MSFRRKASRHDEFQQIAQKCIADFEAAGLPPDLYRSEAPLIDFLSSGVMAASNRGNEIRLEALSDEQFGRLENAVNAIIPDGWHQCSLTALSKERLRRFGRYA